MKHLLAVVVLAMAVHAAEAQEIPEILSYQEATQTLLATWEALPEQNTAPKDKTPRHLHPAVPGADAGALQGFIRVMNRSPHAGEVSISAIDDTGERFGPVFLFMEAWESKQFNSEGLEHGNPSIGLSGGVGDGVGMWRVEMRTSLDTRSFAYIRTPDGFLTSMNHLAPERRTAQGDYFYRVPFFNPASNTSIRSYLRVINSNDESVAVLVGGMDSTGYLSPPVTFALRSGEATRLSAQQLEEGDLSLPLAEGRMGRGKGKWELVVIGSAPLQVLGLLSTRSGHLSNVSQ